MSFCLRPNVCKKCGKPLTLFEGWTCLECEKCENSKVLEQIRIEIEAIDVTMGIKDYPFIPKAKVLEIIDKYTKGERE